ncbi:MAG: ABC transporter ATP-binding protein [Phycisphaeraceae bacterium]
MPENPPVLEVRDLRTSFFVDGRELRAVDGASFTARRGRTLAIVGESGCGKTVTAYSILQLIQKPGRIVSGEILLHPAANGSSGKPPVDLAVLKPNAPALFHVRGGRIGMIFQEPMTALSPVHSIGDQLREALRLHRKMTRRQADELAVEMLARVGIPAPAERLRQYPFEMSGGMRQRVVIAAALICRPQLVIADEPTTALDVTIQAQVLQLLRGLGEELGMSMLLITHDLGVVAQMADEVAVMYLGRIVERGPVRSIFTAPRHPYTCGLHGSLPSLHSRRARLSAIEGSVPPLDEIPAGCPYHPRCPHHQPGRCDVGPPPPLREVGGSEVACLRAEEIA